MFLKSRCWAGYAAHDLALEAMKPVPKLHVPRASPQTPLSNGSPNFITEVSTQHQE